MTHQEIKELAGDRAVSPWVMKLVNAAVAKEREACAVDADWCIQNHLEQHIPKRIRQRGNK
jgi:hypothetical protein